MALFASYTFQITLICFGIIFAMWIGGLFPQSVSNHPCLFFFYFWIQGFAGFGFVVMIVAFLP